MPAIKAATGVDLFIEHVKLQLGIVPEMAYTVYKFFGWITSQ